MDRSSSRDEQKVKTNSTYQRDMERSFAVIYHNLRRIQDDKQGQEPSKRRRHSEPQIHAPNPALLDHHQQQRFQRSNSVTCNSSNSRQHQRRVSFSNVVCGPFTPISHESTINHQETNSPTQDKEQEKKSYITS